MGRFSLQGDVSSLRLGRWGAALLGVGILLRLGQFAMGIPIWGDQAGLGLNIVNRGFGGLLLPLDNRQVAPPGFLFSERAIYDVLGMSEYSMRLLPLLAGIAALLLFNFWARCVTSRLAATIATGILAVSATSVRHSAELKPYSWDLLASLLILVPATLFLLRMQQRWLVVLIALTPVALVMSYPAMFIAVGALLTLTWTAVKIGRSGIVLIALFALVLAATLVALVWPVVAEQNRQTGEFMRGYWAGSFPPGGALVLTRWIVETHTGKMFGYPLEGDAPWCVGAFALFAIGIVSWISMHRRALLGLLLIPFALTLLAAALRRYPYGGSDRVVQHLAPAIVLIMGVGAAWLLERVGDESRRAAWVGCIFLAFIAIGVVIGAADVFWPSDARRAQNDMRHFMRNDLLALGAQPTVMVLAAPIVLPDEFQWYLREQNAKIIWNPGMKNVWDLPGPLWVINFLSEGKLLPTLERDLRRKSTRHWVQMRSKDDPSADGNWNAFGFPAVTDPSTFQLPTIFAPSVKPK
jgi:4-amino-4-deoxy-L-arabinose transferase-like glycosyltransferase